MFNRKYFIIFFIVSIIFLTGIEVNATDSLLPLLQEHQQYKITIITPQGEAEYDYFVDFAVDHMEKKVKVYTKGTGYITTSYYGADLGLINSEMEVVNQADVERVGFNHRIATATSDDNIEIEFLLAETLMDKKKLKLKEQAVEFEILGLYLQGLLLQETTEFHGHLVDINGVGKYELNSKILDNKEIQKMASGKNIPPQVVNILNEPQNIYVFSLGYNGMLRWFFPVRFHVVLEKEKPHRILAFWGGSSDLLRYHLYSYQL